MYVMDQIAICDLASSSDCPPVFPIASMSMSTKWPGPVTVCSSRFIRHACLIKRCRGRSSDEVALNVAHVVATRRTKPMLWKPATKPRRHAGSVTPVATALAPHHVTTDGQPTYRAASCRHITFGAAQPPTLCEGVALVAAGAFSLGVDSCTLLHTTAGYNTVSE